MTTEHSASRPDRPAVLVTGANRGIGRATAEALAADHHLILGGRDAQALSELADRLPSAEPFVAELTDAAATADAVAALELPGGLAGLVHSAGVLVNGTVEEALNAVSGALTTENLTEMMVQVVTEGQDPGDVAREFVDGM